MQNNGQIYTSILLENYSLTIMSEMSECSGATTLKYWTQVDQNKM